MTFVEVFASFAVLALIEMSSTDVGTIKMMLDEPKESDPD